MLIGASLAAALFSAALVGCGNRPREARGTMAGHANTPDKPAEEATISVDTIRPKRDPSFEMSDTEPAYVEAYYRADLHAPHVTGAVKFIRKDKGDRVTKGEVLAEIDVPDLVQEVLQKVAMVEQAQMELKLAEKQVPVATEAVDVAQKNIQQKQAEIRQADATVKFRKLELDRVKLMVSRNALYRDVADERQRDLEAAEALVEAARAAADKATADWKETKAKLEAVRADVNLKQALVDVARKNRDKAQALADYAKVSAPFDGVIVGRTVGPGSFVQDAATAHAEPLLTVERTDIVTVHSLIPDIYAPYVDRKTEAVLEMTELPGQLIHGRVSRFPPSLNPNDRRMRVEVDLYNGNEKDYQQFLAKEKASGFADLKYDSVPLFPRVTAKGGQQQTHPLYPGMFGTMRLVLRKFQDAFLVPSSAVFTQGGKPYIYQVKDGKAHLVPVERQLDDGKLAKVAVIVRVGDEEVKQNLTGAEEIVATNQGELSDGQPVKTNPLDRSDE
jgi:multidrug efflux pump subunit AcrA (membrane-fusion protein)